jgi:ACS family 4-hydroxyphenylacetate permease-like MFS transporter
MSTAAQLAPIPETAVGDQAIRRASGRLLWFLFILLVVSFMDRINIAFAGLTMNKELGLTAAMFGLSVTVFYIAYTLCEIPSNLMLAKYGARLWIGRIMITWGLAALRHPGAGRRRRSGIPSRHPALPDILVSAHPSRAGQFLFLIGIPATIAIASTLSGLVLQMDGLFGLAGWRWLFLLEGLPAVVLGVACLFYLDDNPARASWLTTEEKSELQSRLDYDRALEESGAAGRGIMRQLGSRNVVLLSIAYFGLISSLNTSSTWTPQIIREFAANASFASIGVIAAIPALLPLVAMPLWGASSDRRNERPRHIRIAMAVAALGWLLVIVFNAPALRFLGLVLVSLGSFCALLTFWTLPASAAILSPDARPAGIALINCVGIGGGSAVTPLVVGLLKDWSGSFTSGLTFVISMLLVSVALITVVASQQRIASAAAQPRSP